MKVAIYLAHNGIDSRVIVDGADISRYVRGVEVRAHVSEITKLSVDFLPSLIEIYGEPGEVVRSLLSLPIDTAEAVSRARVVELSPSAVVVVECDRLMPMEQKQRLSTLLSEVWPGRRVVVLDDDVRLRFVEERGELGGPGDRGEEERGERGNDTADRGEPDPDRPSGGG